MSRPIRVVIADDHSLFRQGLKALLESEPEVVVVAETDRADALPGILDDTSCDLLLLDLQMEHDTLADIAVLAARVPVVVLTASEVAPTRSPRSARGRRRSCSSASRSRR